MKYALFYDSRSRKLKVTDPKTRFVYLVRGSFLVLGMSNEGLRREIRRAIKNGRQRNRRRS